MYDTPVGCRNQRVMSAPKVERNQRQWLVLHLRNGIMESEAVEWRENAEPVVSDKREHTTPDSAWRWIDSWRDGGSTTWVVCWASASVIEWLEVWDRLRDGLLDVPHKLGGNLTITSDSDGRRNTGAMALGPTVTEIDLLTRPGKVKLLDLLNWSIEPALYGHTLGECSIFTATRALLDWLWLVRTCKAGPHRTTSASQGWARYRYYDLGPRLVCNRHLAHRALEREASYGGRCEPYRLGKIDEHLHYVDIRSCYAAICQRELLPYVLQSSWDHPEVERLKQYSDNCHWIAEVIIDTLDPVYPVRWDGDAIYPIGRFRTVLAWPELRHALLRGNVFKILRANRYVAESVLGNFADWFQSAKQLIENAGMSNLTPLLKNMFNMALGYSAKRKYQWVPYQCDLPGQWWYGWIHDRREDEVHVRARRLSGVTERLDTVGEPVESYPYLHATICSYARMQLWDLICTAKRKHVVYCDTDGLLVTEEGLANLEARPELWEDRIGCLSVRCKGSSGYVSAKKVYRVGDYVVAAGVPRARLDALKWTVRQPIYWGHVHQDMTVVPFVVTSSDLGDGEEDWQDTLHIDG